MAEEIIFEIIDEQVALITLNRPSSLNSLNGELVQALNKALDRCASEKQIRSVS